MQPAAAVTVRVAHEVTGHSARILTAAKPQEHNTPAEPDAVAVRGHDGMASDDGAYGHGLRVELPPHSYVTVELALAD